MIGKDQDIHEDQELYNKTYKMDDMHNMEEAEEARLPNAQELSKEELLLELVSCQEKLSEKEEAYNSLFQQLQRLQADFDNYRKRVVKERQELRCMAAREIIEDILPVLDNIIRAVEAGKQKGDLESFLQGIQMINEQLWGALQKHGLRPVDCLGKEFDPEVHQAVAQCETHDEQDNMVLEEIRRGYYLNDKLIRPSMVKVSKNS